MPTQCFGGQGGFLRYNTAQASSQGAARALHPNKLQAKAARAILTVNISFFPIASTFHQVACDRGKGSSRGCMKKEVLNRVWQNSHCNPGFSKSLPVAC